LTARSPVAYATPMQKLILKNKKARFNYEVLSTFEAGAVLEGHEVKSLKTGGGNFTGSFISLINGELWIKGFHIRQYDKSHFESYEPERPRKLLLRKAEIQKMTSALSTQGTTIIPLACGINRGRIKFEIALCRGKKKHDKRNDMKNRDQDRRIKAALKNY
jgi:SsrA-binding protein